MTEQINLSYECISAVLSLEGALESMRTLQKLEMFDCCVQEIEMLICVSVLSQFYESDEFNRIALSRLRRGHIASQQPRHHAMSIRGYAKRMPSLYDTVSKTEEKSDPSPALTVSKVPTEHSTLSLTRGAAAENRMLGLQSLNFTVSPEDDRTSPISTEHDREDLSSPLPLVLSPVNTVNGIRPYHRKVARGKITANNTPPILVVECILKFV